MLNRASLAAANITAQCADDTAGKMIGWAGSACPVACLTFFTATASWPD
jgi:hypothetical protein